MTEEAVNSKTSAAASLYASTVMKSETSLFQKVREDKNKSI